MCVRKRERQEGERQRGASVYLIFVSRSKKVNKPKRDLNKLDKVRMSSGSAQFTRKRKDRSIPKLKKEIVTSLKRKKRKGVTDLFRDPAE